MWNGEAAPRSSFNLDRARVHCEEIASGHARCRVTDGKLSTVADLFVNPDGSLDRVEVLRPYDRGEGRTTLERFTGKASGAATWGGRRFPTRIEGTWNLPEGDLPYVDFEVESARFD
jgi:hypothetical protein